MHCLNILVGCKCIAEECEGSLEMDSVKTEKDEDQNTHRKLDGNVEALLKPNLSCQSPMNPHTFTGSVNCWNGS